MFPLSRSIFPIVSLSTCTSEDSVANECVAAGCRLVRRINIFLYALVDTCVASLIFLISKLRYLIVKTCVARTCQLVTENNHTWAPVYIFGQSDGGETDDFTTSNQE